MGGLEIVIAVAVIGVIAAAAKRANRRVGKERASKVSWLVRAWNSSGARKLEGFTFGDAAAELTGRSAGATWRGGRQAAGWTARKTVIPLVKRGGRVARWTASKAAVPLAKKTAHTAGTLGRSVAARARRRWEARPEADRVPLLARRPRPQPSAPDVARTPGRARRLLRRLKGKPDASPASSGAAPASAQATPVEPSPAGGRHAAPPRRRRTPDLRLAPPPSVTGEAAVTTPNTTSTNGSAPAQPNGAVQYPPPPDWALLAQRIRDFEPSSDTALERFMVGEMAGVLVYADALKNVHETCVGYLGLDPASVQGLADYAEAASDAGSKMASAHRRWKAVYNEIIRAVQNGLVMPFKGRFFTGRAS